MWGDSVRNTIRIGKEGKAHKMMRPVFRAMLLAVATSIAISATAQETKPVGSAAPVVDSDSADSDSSVPAEDPSAAAKKKEEQGTYAVRLRDLEDRVNRLKEQIFRSKARLSLLAETVLDRKIAGARSRIVFRNEMGGSFRLQKATFLLDGGPVFNKSDEGGSLAEKKSIDLFDGPVMPGDHTLNVVLNYQGNGYGVFSYLKGYAFKTRSTHTFTVAEGKLMSLDIIGFEKGGATTPLEERPAIRYMEKVSDYVAPEQAPEAAAGQEK